MTFAMTFPPGTHAMWIRYWLASGGINPDKDVTLITIPPPQMVANMKVGKMDGYLRGRAVARARHRRRHRLHRHHHPADVEGPSGEGARLHRGVRDEEPQDGEGGDARRAGGEPVDIDKLENRPKMAEVVSQPQYINTTKEVILGRLLGDYDYGDGRGRRRTSST